MREYIALDAHKHYSLAEREEVSTGRASQERIAHCRGAIATYLADAESGTPVAVEALGSWYWIVEEIELAGCRPLLVHPRKAKLMMGMINKTDKLDVRGLNRLQRNGTLPTVWVPPRGLRDLRELTRGRMVLSAMRTRLKNRITSALAKYGLAVTGASDAFGVKGRRQMAEFLEALPEETAWTTRSLLRMLSAVQGEIAAYEQRLAERLETTEAMRLQRTLPGFGPILSAVVVLEMGDVERFADAEHLASYAGTTPRVTSSGGKTRYGPLRPDVNRYLKWAFVEAANVIVCHRHRNRQRHVSRLYDRLKAKKGHAKAVGAVARHLAEATYWVQTRGSAYRDPALPRVKGRAKREHGMSPIEARRVNAAALPNTSMPEVRAKR
jgi:transposase